MNKNLFIYKSLAVSAILTISCGQDDSLSPAFLVVGSEQQKIDGGANDAPVLDASKSPLFAPLRENASVPIGAVGTRVSSLVDMASPQGQLDNVSDVDSNTSIGIAITAADSSNGTWYYSTNNGTVWSALGSVSTASSRLLAADSSTLLYFQPNTNFYGTVSAAITFRAWDRTTGINGTLASTSSSGGSSAFSAQTDTASIDIVPSIAFIGSSTGSSRAEITSVTANVPAGTSTDDVMVASVAISPATMPVTPPTGWTLIRREDNNSEITASLITYYKVATSSEPSTYTWALSVESYGSVVSIQTYRNVNTTNPIDTHNGASTANGLTHTAPSITTTTASVLITHHMFASCSTWTPPSLMTELTDAMSYVSNSGGVSLEVNFLSLSSRGSTSSATASASNYADVGATQSLALNGLYLVSNKAPSLDSTRSPSLVAVNQNTSAPSGNVGMPVAGLVDFTIPTGQVDNVTDTDTSALLGIAVTATNTSYGTLFYSLDNGSTWTEIGSVSHTSARLLAANANTRVYFQPTTGYSGTLTNAFTFRAWDQTTGQNGALASVAANGGETAFSADTDTVAITVTAVNQAPQATNLSTSETYNEDTTLNLVDIVVSDSDSSTVTATLTLSNLSAGSLSVGTSGAVTSTYNASTGVWTASGAVADVNTLLAGVSFEPASNYNDIFTLATSVTDGVASAVTGTKTFTGVAINDAPSATHLSSSETYTEDTPLNLIDTVVSDVDSSTITATLTLSNLSAGSLSVGTSGAVTSTYNASTGVWAASGAVADVNTLLAAVSFVPASNYNASFVLATSVSDGVASALTGTKTFTGVAVNDAPSATHLSSSETYTEDTPLNLIDIVVSDVDSSTITATLTLSNLSAGSLSVGTSGAVTSTYNANTGVWAASGAVADVNTLLAAVSFVPASNYNGNFVLATSVTDGLSSVLTGAKFFTGVAVNNAPSLSTVSILTEGTEDTPYNITYAALLEASDAFDAENDTLIFRIESVSTGTLTLLGDAVTPGTTTLSTGQTLVWTPSLNSNGTLLAFTVKVYDASTYSSSAVQVSVDVAAVNDAPVAMDDEALVEEGSFVRLSVLNNDIDAENITLNLEIVTHPSHGTLDVDSEGTVTYTHDGSETNSDIFTYTVTDGILTSNIAEVSLNVVLGNDAPTMDTIETFTHGFEDTAYNISYDSLLDASNASDTENDTLAFRVEEVISGTLLYKEAPAEEGVTLLGVSETLQWTPPLNQHGLLEAFRVRVWDGLLASQDPVSVFVQVASVNSTPVVLDDNGETEEGGVVDVSVLANDFDEETTSFVPVINTQPLYGSVSVLPNGSLRYTHNGGESTSDSFTYSIQDEGGLSAQGTVRITIHPVNDAPYATNLSAPETYTEDTPLDLTDMVVSDIDSDTVTAEFVFSNTSAGSLEINPSSTVVSIYHPEIGTWVGIGTLEEINQALSELTYIPATHFTESFTLTATVSDGSTSIYGVKNFEAIPSTDNTPSTSPNNNNGSISNNSDDNSTENNSPPSNTVSNNTPTRRSGCNCSNTDSSSLGETILFLSYFIAVRLRRLHLV